MKNIFVIMTVSLISVLDVVIADDNALQKNIKATLEKAEISRISADAKIVDSQPTNIKGIRIISLRQPEGFQLPVLVSDDGKTIIGIPEFLISSDENFKDTLKKVYEDAINYNTVIRETNVLNIFKKYTSEVVKFVGKKSNKTTYMIVDPNCPYCYAEIQKLKDTLENFNVEILVVGALGQASINKAASFYQDYRNLRDKNSQEDVITLLKNIFKKSYKTKESIDISKVSIIGGELFQAGVNSVPYIIEK